MWFSSVSTEIMAKWAQMIEQINVGKKIFLIIYIINSLFYYILKAQNLYYYILKAQYEGKIDTLLENSTIIKIHPTICSADQKTTTVRSTRKLKKKTNITFLDATF